MLEFIKREMPDMSGKGEKKYYFKPRTYGNFNSEKFFSLLCNSGSGLAIGDVYKVMGRLIEELKHWLALGHTITIDGLGTFSLSIGPIGNNEVENLNADGKNITGKQIKVRGVNFRPSKQLVNDLGQRCQLHKGYDSPNNRSPYSRDERLRIAQEYIGNHHFMRVGDYASITNIPHSTAAKELCEFISEPTTGIDFTGRGNTKIYIKRE